MWCRLNVIKYLVLSVTARSWMGWGLLAGDKKQEEQSFLVGAVVSKGPQ